LEAEELLEGLRVYFKIPELAKRIDTLEERIDRLEQKLDQLISLEVKKLEAYEAMEILQALRESHPGVKMHG
jgi:uncharacterized protein with PhoU and TrkA domain